VLGDRAAQDAIREKTAGVAHCPILRSNPSGCTGCANNPHEKERPPTPAVVDEAAPYLARAFRQHLLAELGLLRPADVSAADLEVLGHVHTEILERRLKLQANFVAATLFGSK